MDICDRRALKNTAKTALQEVPCNHKMLILTHTAIAAAVVLAIALINVFLDYRIADLGGLSGLGARTTLSAVQTVLRTASSIALPFWEMGYLFAVLRLARRQEANTGTLLDGFRNFGPVLRFYVLKYLLLAAIAFLCYYPSFFIFMLTPLSTPFIEALMPALSGNSAMDMTQLMLDDAAMEAATEALVPMLLIFLVVYLIVVAPVYYRLRLAEFALADDPQGGALRAMRASARMTKHRCMKLFLLDLSYWWFYALEGLLALLCYGDVLLPMLGVRLPFSDTAAYFLFYSLNLAGQILLYWWRRNEMMTTYAVVYDHLKDAPAPAKPAPQQTKQPWNF